MLHEDVLSKLCRARDMLRTTQEPAPTVRQVAREVGLSVYHFIRLFKAVFGETPNQFQIRARLEEAKHLLVATDRSVTDVCMDVGYTSLGSFSDVFARRVGVPPSTYRQQIRSMGHAAGDAAPLTPGCLSLMGAVPE